MSEPWNQIKGYVRARLRVFAEHSDESTVKAWLANLRRGVGRKPGDIPELWGVFLQNLPDELQGREEPSYAEWAIYTTLTLFAVHQQGHDMNAEFMDQDGMTLGRAMRCLVQKMEGDMETREERVRCRLNRLATSADIPELAVHMREIIKLLSVSSIKLDYPELAEDIYWYQFSEKKANVRLKWGQDFYKYYDEKEEEE